MKITPTWPSHPAVVTSSPLRPLALVLGLAAVFGLSEPAAAEQWNLSVVIGDGSTPPPGVEMTYTAFCYYTPPAPAEPGPDWGWIAASTPTPEPGSWWRRCAEDLPIGGAVLLDVEKSPFTFHIAPSNPGAGEYYNNRREATGCYTAPVCDPDTDVELEAKWGSVEGYVRLDSDRQTPIPGVEIGAYNSTGQRVTTAVTDANGHYEFQKVDAEPWDIDNHWALGVTHWIWSTNGNSLYYGDYYVLAFPLGTIAPDTISIAGESTKRVFPSIATRKDFFLEYPEGEEQDPDEEGGDEEEPEEDRTGKCPEDDSKCKEPTCEGKPVRLATGAVFFRQTDAVVRGIRRTLEFKRRYNSRRAFFGHGGAFGRGWEHSLEKRLTPAVPDRLLRLEAGTGGPLYFQDTDGDGTFEAAIPLTERSWIVASGGSYTRHFSAGGSEDYDTDGLLASQVDAVGNVTSLSRDGSGQLTAIVVPGGRTLTFEYSNGHVSRLLGPAGEIASYSYTPEGMLEQVTYASGSGYGFTYDSEGQVLTVTDLTGRIIESHTYSGGKALTSEIADGEEQLTFSYEPSSTIATDAGGRTGTYALTKVAGLTRVFSAAQGCASCGQSGYWNYDVEGRITQREWGEGWPTQLATYTYDADGNFASVTLPLGRTTNYTRDSQGRLLTRLGPDNALTTWTYGPAGPLTITDPLDRTTSITYSPAGLMTAITNPVLETTTFAYNGFGDLVSVTDPLNHTTIFDYDELGRRTNVTDALDRTTTTTYDGQGRVTRITAPDGTHADFTYDGGGRPVSLADPAGRLTRYGYDPHGRLKTVQDPSGATVRYDYDPMSRLAALTDARGQTTRFHYDTLGRVIQVTYPNGATESFSYDEANRLATKTDRREVLTTYEYDAADRLTQVIFSDGTAPRSFTYDAADRTLSAENGTDTLSWSHDEAGQLLSEASALHGSTVSYTYDGAGRRLSVALDGTVVASYGHDDASRLVSLTAGPQAFAFGYDEASQRTTMSTPNGIATSYTYDPVGRLASLQAVLGGTTPITGFTYGFDVTGNRTSRASLAFTEAYSHDPIERLTGVERSGGLTGRSHFRYDPVGNRTTTQIDDSVTSAAYNELNQLLTSSGGGPLRVRGVLDEPGTARVNDQAAQMLSGDAFEATIDATPGTNSFTVEATDGSGNVRTDTYEVEIPAEEVSSAYDAVGNLVTKTEGATTWGYVWNGENQLIRVTRDGVEIARFGYDPFGRRVEKVAGALTTRYTYDGEDILRETRTDGTSFTYIHGPGIDEPLAREDGAGALIYYHADALGSVVKRTDLAGGVVHGYRYDAWGNIEVGSGEAGYAYTSREWDPEISLYYYRARYYDPKVGRFVSEDPIGFAGGENFYEYVFSNPVTLTDPSGLDVQLCQRPMQGMPNYTHTYVYSTRAGTGYGLGPKGGWKYVTPWVPVPGVLEPDSPLDPKGQEKPDNTCNTVDKSQCVERCILRTFYADTKKPPKYNLGKYQCNDYADDIIRRCRQQCGR